jgi:hydroxyacylglutathione hydrolase
MKASSQYLRVAPIALGFVNAYLVLGERPILVDAGYVGQSARIRKAFIRYGIAARDLALIVLTHGHSDHFGSLVALKEASGAPVAIHPLDAEALRTGINPPLHPTDRAGQALGWLAAQLNRRPPQGLEPDILIQDGMSLEPYGVEGRILCTPGHTPGSISLALATRDVLIGDLLIATLPWSHHPRYPLVADNLEQVRASVQQVLALSPRRLWSAHGGPFTPEEVAQHFPWA